MLQITINHRTMKRILFIIALVSVFSACTQKDEKKNSDNNQIACDSLKKATDSDAPDWYNNPPASDNKYYFGIGKGTSKDMSIAERKAVMQANLNLAEQITASTSTNGTTTTTEATLVDVSIEKKTCKKVESTYNTYILVKMKRPK